MSTTKSPAAVRIVSTSTIAAATVVIALFWTFYEAHSWGEIGVVAAVTLIAAAVVFAVVVPIALRRGRTGGLSLALAIPAVVLVLPAFWSGLPLVLGAGGALLGASGRASGHRSASSTAGLVIGLVAVAAYLGLYLFDTLINGNRGFLLG